MKWNRLLLYGFLTWIIQLIMADFLAINTVRPDFIVILVLYSSLIHGRLTGIIFGFFIGILVDLSGTASFFGLSPLTYSITGYLSGSVLKKHKSISLFYFSISWVIILGIHFLIFSLIQYQHILSTDSILFLSKWIATSIYTLCFAGILQFIYPLHKSI